MKKSLLKEMIRAIVKLQINLALNSDYLKGQKIDLIRRYVAYYDVYKNINGLFYGVHNQLLYGPFKNLNDLNKFMNTNNRKLNTTFKKNFGSIRVIDLPKLTTSTKAIIRNFDKKLDLGKEKLKLPGFNMLDYATKK